MVADNGRQVLVCINCKLRKKKCDKVQPSCGYCTKKNLECRYYSAAENAPNTLQKHLPSAATTSPLIQSSLLLSSTLSEVLASEPKTLDSTLYLQTLRIIRSTGRDLSDVTAQYFRGIHSFAMVVSRPRFHDQLISLGPPPTPGFSILLLSMCLITHHPDLIQPGPSTIDQVTLYLATKTLFTQAQASSPPSLHLIQAGIIIAAYEYSSERLNDSFATISVCARLGYAISLDQANPDHTMDKASFQQAEEEANTWWGILILERTIICEGSDLTLPLTTKVPGADARLPSDPSTSDIDINKIFPSNIYPGSGASLNDEGGIACVAQGTLLLDQVISAFQIPDLDSRLNRLNGLHHAIRTVLGTVLDESKNAMGAFCTANGILIRTMYLVHQHILTLVPRMNAFKYKSREEWTRSSHAALETATTMAEDIAESQGIYSLATIDTLPPSCKYVHRAAMEYIESLGGFRGRELIRRSIKKFDQRWGVS